MKVIGLIGVSALGRSTFVDDLIEALRLAVCISGAVAALTGINIDLREAPKRRSVSGVHSGTGPEAREA